MKTKVGLWIDHRKAIIVTVSDKGEEVGLIVSKGEKQLQRSGDSPLKGRYESLKVPADDSRQRMLTGHLNIYYEAVIAGLRDAESILIFGPGEAKDELKLPQSVHSGAVVKSVQPGSAADAAGFQQGDVIIQADDTAVQSADDLGHALSGAKPGTSVGVKIYRGDVEQFLVVEIPAR